MAIRQGRCTNFGNCGAADRKQIIPIADGADFVCPECNRQLTDMGRPEGSGSRVGIVVGLLLLLLLLGGLGYFLGLHKRAPRPGVLRFPVVAVVERFSAYADRIPSGPS